MQSPREGHEMDLAGRSVSLPWPALEVVAADGMNFVLLDPDSYLQDAEYRAARRAGAPAIKNLWAFTPKGEKLWEAELPESSDYYYKIVSVAPLVALSFSSWRCVLIPATGNIQEKQFLK